MITFCGCLGPMYGEPYCICTMERLGIPLNEAARKIENERAQEQLKNLDIWFAKNKEEQ